MSLSGEGFDNVDQEKIPAIGRWLSAATVAFERVADVTASEQVLDRLQALLANEHRCSAGEREHQERDNPLSRWKVLKYTLATAMLGGMLLSPRLWVSSRSYPLAPVWDGLPTVTAPWDRVVFGGLIAALVAVIVAPRPRLAMMIFVVLAMVWSLWDQTRWQPWFYQYLVMFVVLAGGPSPGDAERSQASLNACRLIVAGVYFWSGLQKLNVLFATDVYPWLMEPVLKHLSGEWHEYVRGSGSEAALLECAIGLGLLVWPLRLLAMVGAVIMHLLILFNLGPWGHDWNSVVWPWNVAMIIFVVVLFARTRHVRPWNILWPRRCLVGRLALVLFGIMPLFNFFECWDSYLSVALYSGNTPMERVYINQEVYDHLPTKVRTAYVSRRMGAALDDPCPYEVDSFNWALEEMNVPNYPAERVSRAFARRMAKLPEKAPSTNVQDVPLIEGRPGVRVILILQGRADWLTGVRREKYVVFPE